MAKGFGAKTTAEEALRNTDLSGKTAVVTGGNSGIGAETARVFAKAGARVIITSRGVEAGQKVADAFKQESSKGEVVVKQLDLADLASVAAFAKDFLATEQRLDLLVLNAGVMACPYATTKDGFEMQIGTNHFGHFALADRLVPKMRSQAFPSRVVALSSMLHEKGSIALDDLHWKSRKYDKWASYSQSKLANVIFAKELASRLQGSQVTAFSVHPGIIPTPLSRHMGFGGHLFRLASRFMSFAKTIPQGAATTVYAATATELTAAQSGSYLADCAVKAPSKAGQDMDMAKRLWDVTEEQLRAAGWAASAQ